MAGKESTLSLPFYFIATMDVKDKISENTYSKLMDIASKAISDYTDSNREKFDEITEIFNGEFGEENVDATTVLPSCDNFVRIFLAANSSKTDEELLNSLDLADTIFKSTLRDYYRNALPIIIKFPRVKITNENDRYVIIQDLYARVSVRGGLMADNFSLQRTTFTREHWESGYAHSHLPNLVGWQNPCLGTGPIANTQHVLKESYNIEMWGLFAYELSKYVTVESLTGVPYKRLESIGNFSGGMVRIPNGTVREWPSSLCTNDIMPRFFKDWVSKNHIKIGYMNNQYVLGESLFKFWIRLSKDFIHWYNVDRANNLYDLDQLQRADIIIRCFIRADNTVFSYQSREHLRDRNPIPTETMFKFKGEDIHVKVEDLADLDSEFSANNSVYILSWWVVSYLLTKLYECANYGQRKQEGGQEDSEEASSFNKEYKIF